MLERVRFIFQVAEATTANELLNPTGYGWNNAQLVVLSDGTIQSVEVPNVFAIQVDVYEVAKLACVVEQSLSHAWERRFERCHNCSDSRSIGVDARLTVGQFPERCWDFYCYGHQFPISREFPVVKFQG